MKKQIAILCGGQSAEHAVSLLSAANVVRDLDAAQFDKVIIYVSRTGHWFLVDDADYFCVQAQKMHIDTKALALLSLQPGNSDYPLLNQVTQKPLHVDCFFPVLHGAKGEDGAMQGLFDVLNIAYVGCNTLSSAMCMDKHITKQILRYAGIPTLDWLNLHVSQKNQLSYDDVATQFGEAFFVKTVSSGSSIGVNKVTNAQMYQEALDDCFHFDTDVIIEPAVNARELEVSVLGNISVRSTPPGEVIVHDSFYTYEAKYFDPNAAEVVVSAKVTDTVSQQCQLLAKKAFQALRCSGLARVDFFVVSDHEVYLNEINTLPGFTNVSMYAKNWLAAGLSYADLLTDLIDLAFERHASRQNIHNHYAQFIAKQREKSGAI